MENIESQHQAIKREFTKQAVGWNKAFPVMLSNLAKRLALSSDQVVLDVAAGSGLVSLALAPGVKKIYAVDITEAMLEQGQILANKNQVSNIEFVLGSAEKLPFEKDTFDTVVTRYSFHHFFEPEAVLMEMKRVCKPGGSVVVMDLIAPENEAEAQNYNELERLRDRTHTTALSLTNLKALFTKMGMNISDTWEEYNEMDFLDWLDFSKTDPNSSKTINSALRKELVDPQAKTGFSPFMKNGRLNFRHRNGTVVATLS